MKITVNNINELGQVVEAFLNHVGTNAVVAFYAPMGAGKTTFIAALCRRLGIDDDAGSPTFSILNEYRTTDAKPIYHFDFYRLSDPAEAFEIGAEDYFYSGNLCLVEWPQIVEPILPPETRNVTITVNPDGSRTFEF